MIVTRLLSKRILKLSSNSLHSKYSAPTSAHPDIISKFRAMAPTHRENPLIMKLETDDFKSLFTDELNSLAALFNKYGYEIRIAGGAVRDLLAGSRPKDMDFATTAMPDQMKAMFTAENVRMINAKGEKHGTITPRINDKENFEVTTLRIDVATDGRHAEVQFTTDWLLDANRRDLTINSMFLGLDGSVYDYFYGYDDLQAKRVAFVGNAVSRIQEDYLRILRYFRFYGRIATAPDEHNEGTLKAITDNTGGLAQISGERIWTEMKKILEGRYAVPLLKRICTCGCAPYIGLPNDREITFDELDRIERECLGKYSFNAVSLLASVIASEEEALNLHARIKFSAFERDLLLFIVAHREPKCDVRPLHPYKVIVLKAKSIHVRDYTIELLKYLNSPHLEEFEQWELPKFPVNGNMLKAQGVEPGYFMGTVMNELRNYWAENNFNLSEGELLKALPEIVDELKTRRAQKKKNK